MEKISNIVRGNSRVAAVDLKRESAVRPGAPSFGRPIGESPHQAVVERPEAAATKAGNPQQEVPENRSKSGGQAHIVEQMSDSFFVNRARSPQVQSQIEMEPAIAPNKGVNMVKASEIEEEMEEMKGPQHHEIESIQPSGFTPRGSYVNVHA